jgi:hypothetical protein
MRLKYRVYSQDKNAHWSCWRGIVVEVLLVGDLWLHAAEWGKVAWLDMAWAVGVGACPYIIGREYACCTSAWRIMIAVQQIDYSNACRCVHSIR